MTTELHEQIATATNGTALEGMTVLEDGGGIAASYAGKLLADLGADVIKLEPPGGDSVRRKPPFAADTPGRERSGLHLFLDTNKRSLTLDVESATGRRIYRQIAKHCGTVITSRPIAEQRRLGLTWDDLAVDSPELNQVSITVFGIDTQREGWQSESLIASLASGISYRIGDPDRAPLGLPYDAPQFQGGIHAAIAALLARRATREDGVGQHAWLSIVDIISNVMAGAGVAAFVFTGQSRGRAGTHMNAFYPWQVTPVKDGYYEVITMVDRQWNRFMELLGDPEWQYDERLKNRWLAFQHVEELDAYWHPWMKERTKAELMQIFGENHISFQPVHTIGEVAESEHLEAREFWSEIEHPSFEEPVRLPGAPYKLSESPWAIRRRPPLLGEHSAEVLSEVGVVGLKLARLRRSGVI
ncbi:MAG: CoA transferase [Chloroflexi bacterium]|nr:CoA transferase [Chloroflexota bacterium]